MLLSFLWSAQVSYVFLLLPLLSFIRFQVLAHAVEDAVHLLVVASLDLTLVLVVVVVVTLVAGDGVLFLHAPALTPTGVLAVVALFLYLLLSSSKT